MNFPTPFLPISDAETPKLPVPPESVPVNIQASGHMMISYNNPIEWGTEEELTEIATAQRTTWSGKKDLGWSGVEYFKLVNPQTDEEEVRLLAIPGSWRRSPNEIVTQMAEAARENPEVFQNLAHGLFTHPNLTWEKPASTRDGARILKSILFRSLLLQTRTVPSNAQLNTVVEFLLENEEFKAKVAEAKKGAEPSAAVILSLPQPVEAPNLSETESEEKAPAHNGGSKATQMDVVTAEYPPLEKLPPAPAESETPLNQAEILEIAKRVLPASRILEARGLVEDAAQDAMDTAKKLLAIK